jgi:predicted nucleotidyltransferase
MSVDRTRELRELAQRIADALPPVVEEVVLTGSVSRGVADEVSDIEMLFVTTEQLSLDDCFEHAGRLGFERMDTWGVQGTEANRVFGFVDGVPVETIWWSREFAERSVDAILGGQPSGTAEALPECSRFCGRETGFSSWSGSSTPACACCRSCTR